MGEDRSKDDHAQTFAEMISMMAHELRSPLTSVKGFSATLVSKWDRFTDDQRRELIGTIHQDAERMGRIVSEVLDIARVEAGRLELARSEIDVGALVREAVAALSVIYDCDRVEVIVPEGLMADVDPERLGHVVRNLVENAIRFSESGPISISAEAHGTQVMIEVADQGVGIEPHRLDRLFDGPGPTGQVATPRGTGLGLYLARRLVKAHGGDITVSSQVDRGSTFSVTLPGTA